MYDLGSPIPLAISLTDALGNPADGGVVKVTIYNVDAGTNTGPVDPQHPDTGSYYYDYAAPNVGHYDVVWTITGANADTITDSFDVQPAPGRFLCSLAEARAELDTPDSITVDDDELRSYIAAATPVIEFLVGGAVLSRDVLDVFDGSRYWSLIRNPRRPDSDLALRTLPVDSITSVTESGVILDPSQYELDAEAGLLTRLASAYAPSCWAPGFRNIEVRYKAGATVTPPNVNLAARQIVRGWWQDGQQGLQPIFDDVGPQNVAMLAGTVRGHVRDLLQPAQPLPVSFA